MKGYAWYVWGSYGVALLCLIVEVILVRHRRKITLQQLRLMRDADQMLMQREEYMKPRQKRFIFILVGIAILSSAVGLDSVCVAE